MLGQNLFCMQHALLIWLCKLLNNYHRYIEFKYTKNTQVWHRLLINSFTLERLSFSSVASFLVWGGGGGASPPNVPGKKSRTCNVYAWASASKTYRPIIFTYSMALYTTISDKTLTLRKIYEYASERGASELWKIFAFSHSKTAIFQYSVGRPIYFWYFISEI